MGVKISELTSAGTLAGTEKMPCVDSGTQYTTPADIKTYIQPTYVTAQATPTRVTAAAPDALGEYRSYLRNAGARTYTETNGSPTTAPNSTDGYLLYANASFAGGDSSGQPSRYELYIGTGKTPQWEFYKNSGRTGKIDITPFISFGGANYDGGIVYGYDPATGVAWVTKLYQGGNTAAAGWDEAGSPITANIYFDIKC